MRSCIRLLYLTVWIGLAASVSFAGQTPAPAAPAPAAAAAVDPDAPTRSARIWRRRVRRRTRGRSG